MLRNPFDEAKAAEVAKLRLEMADCYRPQSLSENKVGLESESALLKYPETLLLAIERS